MSANLELDGLLNSAGARMIPVEQSSADESSTPVFDVAACSKNCGDVFVATLISSKMLSSAADTIRFVDRVDQGILGDLAARRL